MRVPRAETTSCAVRRCPHLSCQPCLAAHRSAQGEKPRHRPARRHRARHRRERTTRHRRALHPPSRDTTTAMTSCIALDDELVAELDRRAGVRRRNVLVAELNQARSRRRTAPGRHRGGSRQLVRSGTRVGTTSRRCGGAGSARATAAVRVDRVQPASRHYRLIGALRGRTASRAARHRRTAPEPWSCAISDPNHARIRHSLPLSW